MATSQEVQESKLTRIPLAQSFSGLCRFWSIFMPEIQRAEQGQQSFVLVLKQMMKSDGTNGSWYFV